MYGLVRARVDEWPCARACVRVCVRACVRSWTPPRIHAPLGGAAPRHFRAEAV